MGDKGIELQHLEKRTVETFCDLARIDSVSFEEGDVAAAIKAWLEGLGAEVRFDDSEEKTGSNTGNLFARLPGNSAGSIAFNAHMDTVEPGRGIEPVVVNGWVKPAGDTILGADDKAAIAAILEGLAWLVDVEAPRPEIHCVFTVAEEKGLVGAKAMDPSNVSADYVFVLDSHMPVGHVTVAAPYQNTLRFTVHGKAAHAGVAPEDGVNAIQAASKAIAGMKLGRIDGETTANIGKVEGGRAINIIPDRVSIEGECRSHSLEKLEAQTKHMLACFKEQEGDGIRVEKEVVREYDGFRFGKRHPAVRLVKRALARIGIQPEYLVSGGGSDANIFNAHGMDALVLSTGMEGVHSTDEKIAVAELGRAAAMVASIAMEAAERG